MKTPVIVGTLVTIGIVIVGLIVLAQTLYVVDATEQAVVARFGDPVAIKTNPGLYAKGPFADTVIRFDNRLLRIDAPAVSMPDIDKQNLTIDSYARYRIIDPLKFFKTLQTESTARARLGDIVTSSLRDEIARSTRTQIIGAERVLDARGVPVIDDEGLPVIEARESRTALLHNVFEAVSQRVTDNKFGVEMIDVKLKRVDFPDRVSEAIFDRMRAEQNRISSRIRADGEAQAARTQAEAEARRTVILAEAQSRVNAIAVEKDAKAIDALIRALAADRDLSQYTDSLEAYKVARGLARR